jgi:hypothetical protein
MLLARFEKATGGIVVRLKSISDVYISDWWTPPHLVGKLDVDPVQITFSVEGQELRVMLKPDNILVEEGTGTFVIFDPR